MRKRIVIYLSVILCMAISAFLLRIRWFSILPSAIVGDMCFLDHVPGNAIIRYDTTYDEVVKEGLSSADNIVRVRSTGEQQAMYHSTLSTVTVIQVWKGDMTLLGHEIAVYERGYFYVRGDKVYYHPGGVENLMHEGGEYILFLKALENPRGEPKSFAEYTMDWAFADLGIDLPCLIPWTDAPTAAIVTEEAIWNDEVLYRDIKETDFICLDNATLDAVVARNEVIKKWFELY